MSDTVILYHNPQSRGRIVRWMLEEVGAPYEVRLIDFKTSAHKGPEFLAVNPMGKLPAISHRGVVVTECAAICAYLADAFPQANLAPPPAERAAYYRWLFFGAGSVEYAIVDRMLGRPAPSRPGALGYGSFDDTMRTLEGALTPGPWLLGERFSAADVYIGSQVGFGLLMKALDPTPTLAAYAERCRARPAAIRASKLDEELTKSAAG
jgi:glutathione S-transferase